MSLDQALLMGGLVLETRGSFITVRTASEFESYDRIVTFDTPDHVHDSVTLGLTGGGTLNLSDELAIPSGGSRDAWVYLLDGSAKLTTGSGNDHLFSTGHDNTVNAGAGDDEIFGAGGGKNILNGGDGDDYITSDIAQTFSGHTNVAYADDTINGGAGDDVIRDGYGELKNISGGSGNDFISIGDHRFVGSDFLHTGVLTGTVDGSAGMDTLFLDQNSDLRGLAITGVETFGTEGYLVTATATQLEGFDHIVGEVVAGVPDKPIMLQLSGSGAVNLSDELALAGGGAHAVTIHASAIGNSITTGAGNDTLNGDVGSDYLSGGAGDDTLFGDRGFDTLLGGSGKDVMHGGADADVLFGGSGDDTMSGDDGIDTVFGEDGNDTISGGADIDTLFGGVGNDVVNGDGGADSLFGEAGNDRLNGGADNDFLYGGDGKDVLIGGSGKDLLFGGTGADTFVFAKPLGSANVDTVADFRAAEGDKIGIVASDFGLTGGHGLTAAGGLDPSWFGAVTGSADQGTAKGHGQFLFNSTTHILSWDPDGSGSAPAEAIASFNGDATLTASSFQVSSSDFLTA